MPVTRTTQRYQRDPQYDEPQPIEVVPLVMKPRWKRLLEMPRQLLAFRQCGLSWTTACRMVYRTVMF